MNKKVIMALVILALVLGTFVVATLATAPVVSAVPWGWYDESRTGCGMGWHDQWSAEYGGSVCIF